MLKVTAPAASVADGGPGDQPGALAVASGPACVLERLRQVRDHLLGDGQFLSERFLGSSEFPGQPALSIPAAKLRRGRLRGMTARVRRLPRVTSTGPTAE